MKTNPTSVYIINDLMNILVNILKKEKLICNFQFDDSRLMIYVRYENDNDEDDYIRIIDEHISYDKLKQDGFDEIVNKIINKLNGYLAYKEIKI